MTEAAASTSPHIEILRGDNPPIRSYRALIAVLGSISGSTPPAEPTWLPVDQLRTPSSAGQRIINRKNDAICR